MSETRGFGLAQLKEEGGPFDPDLQLPRTVYAALAKRARDLNSRNVARDAPERAQLRTDIEEAFARAYRRRPT